MNPGKLIHYGDKEFKPRKFLPISNAGWIKPKGGLWTSPLDSKHSWKQWCEAENFGNCSKEAFFIIELKEEARILKVDSPYDLKQWPQVEESNPYLKNMNRFLPDFETLTKSYDAIWLTEIGETSTRFGFHDKYSLYGWDCETVLILNKESIVIPSLSLTGSST
jgi:hypothetical protein